MESEQRLIEYAQYDTEFTKKFMGDLFPKNLYHIDRARVHDIYADCLFSVKNSTHYIKVVGDNIAVLFNADAIEEYSDEIHGLLNNLPEGFTEENGGESIIRAINTRSGKNWGDWSDAHMLCLLGVASGWARIVQSSSFPYIVIMSNREEVEYGSKEELGILDKIPLDSMRIGDLYKMHLPTQVIVDVHKRISDWLLSGGSENDSYIQQQLQYARSIHTCIEQTN